MTATLWVMHLLLAAVVGPQTPAAGATYRLAGVEVAGARRYTAADLAKVGGLAIGQSVSVPDVAAAAGRLGGSGLFKNLSYRYVTTAGRITVTFEFEEADWTVPVVLDNFVWIPDAELIAAVRQDVPSFDGKAPPTEGVIDLFTKSLGGILKARQLPGQVNYTPEADLKGNLLRHVFNVRDPSPKICAMTFPGASAIPEAQLLEPIRQVVGGDYSRVYVTAVSRGTLTNLYRKRGHWRAEFTEPVVTIDQAAGCSGVSVALTVTEGSPYQFERAEWAGTTVLPPATLSTLLGLKAGELADISKLENGLRVVHTAYGKQGHVAQSARYTPRLDDATQRAVFDVSVNEGPQFRMGTLEVMGLADRDAAELQKRWRLQPGDVFDATYEDQFRQEVLYPMRRGGPSAKPGSVQTRVDAERRAVDVRIVFN